MGNRSTQSLILRSQSLMTKIMAGQQQQVIKHLEQQKIDHTQSINQMGDTVGHYAAYRGHMSVLAYLADKGDRFQTLNNRALTAIDIALPETRQWMYRNRK